MATYTIAAYPKELSLRDGSKVDIRPLEREDGDALLQFFLSIPEDERYFLKEDVTSPTLIEEWLGRLNYERALPLLALVDGRIVADAVLIRRRGNARSHIGEIRLVVVPEWRNRGLGTTLIRELCDIADDAGLEKVLFEIVAEREKEALTAAEWLGFLRIGTIEGAARDPEGHRHDVILLSMPLGKWYQWTRF
ncbi:MAG: GNAT family N-acetyltransferase [Dehalococcoidia bacterium]